MEQMNMTQLKQMRANMLMRLGEETHRILRAGSSAVSDEMLELSNQIKEIDVQIAKGSGMMSYSRSICPGCGAQIEEGNLFCANCGLSIQEYEAQFVGTCGVCGAKRVKDQVFCDICGSVLGQ